MENEFIKSMARRIIAGKEPPAQQDLAAPQQDPAAPSLTPPPPAKTEPTTARTYYFTATQSIDFSGFHNSAGGVFSPGSVDMAPTLDKLKHSLSGQNTYQADYFAWQKMVIKTDIHAPGKGDFVTYTCNTTSFGGKKDATIDKNVQIPGIGNRPEDIITHIEESLGVFKPGTVPGGNKVINLDSSSETLYYNTSRPGEKLKFQDVTGMSNNFRVWGPENRLMFPDMQDPRNTKKDGALVNGYYAGGQGSYNALLQKLKEAGIEVPGAESEGDTKQAPEQAPEQPSTAPAETPFEPVDEQGDKTPVKGQIIDKTAKNKDKKRSPGDYASVPYSGGTDVMQRLFYDQAKNMKIRQAAMKVAGMYLKEAEEKATFLALPTGLPPQKYK